MCRTTAGNRWRIRSDIPAETRNALDALARTEPTVESFEVHAPSVAAYRELLEAAGPAPTEYRGPAFVFPNQLPDAPRAIGLTDENRASCATHYPWVLKEWDDPIHPMFVILENGVAVSICHSARSAPRAAEAGVETLEAARGHGYAVEVVAAWARAIRESVRLPTYGTEWSNAASRAVAAKLGLELYGEDFSLT